MFSFEYEDWKMVCSQIFLQKYWRKRSYLQWYPFTKLSRKEKETVTSEVFFNNYIKSGLFLYYSESWLITDNYILKGDGNFRNATLISPIMYLTALTVGKSISKIFTSNRQRSIEVFYAGNYDENRFFYKKDYDVFFKTINTLTQSYKYFIKTDIKDFFPNIDMNKLFDIINLRFSDTNTQINQKDLLIYKELLLCLGQGEFPLIENSVVSSFLATIVYLEEPDNKIFTYIENHEIHVTNFSMVRYVDDLYVLFNSDLSEDMINPVANRILNAYSSELKKLNLSLNREKTLWKYTKDISEELKKSLYDEQVNDKECNITDLVDSSLLLRFIKGLKESLYEYTLDRKRYIELIDEIFNLTQVEYTPQEIYNTLVYDKKHTLFQDKTIIEIFLELIKFDYNFLKLDTKRLTIMLLKTQDGSLIKTMLSKLFEANNLGVWNIYDTSIAVNYLLQRNFNHFDILEILKDKNEPIYSYYKLFCKSSFMASMEESKQSYIRRFEKFIFHKKDDKLLFLYFMYMIERNRMNSLSAFAYYKNFLIEFLLIWHIQLMVFRQKVNQITRYIIKKVI